MKTIKTLIGIVAIVTIFAIAFTSCDNGTTNSTWSITWHLDDGTWSGGSLPTQIENGMVLAKPTPDPTKSGNNFAGWFENEDKTIEYNFEKAVTKDINIYAKWTQAVAYSVSQVGGANGTATTTAITFTFNSSISSLNLTASDINITGTAVTGETTLTEDSDSDTIWTLSLDTVNQSGLVTITINKIGIESIEKEVFVYKKGDWLVTSEDDTNTAGTLRYAITNSQSGDIIRLAGITTIELTSRLAISKSITIEGNGVVLTPNASFTAGSSSQLMYISGSTTVVNISRIHFKDARATGSGGAVYNYASTLTMESCIFSGNQTSSGAAVYNLNGTINITGCTFYENSASSSGGAIYSSGGTVNITGNLFYGNTGGTYPVVRNISATITSGGFNVVDAAFGTGSNQSGWTEANTDKTIDAAPISPTTFRLLPASGAANVITTRPINYPTVDFYGSPINNGAAAGAVQGEVSGSGYVIEVSVNNSSRGSVNISPGPNADGLYSGNVTLTATETAGYIFRRWVINGSNAGNSKTMPMALSANTTVQAIFSKIYAVNSADDTTTEGTLRHALTNAQDEDIVSISNTVTTIQLSSRLPTISRSITIEGNGVVLTPNASFTAGSSSQLMYISGSTTEVNISQIHFKDARATSFGGAVYNYGILTLESCIFSGNQAGNGGAVMNSGGTLNIRGCTFYGNSASDSSGAIYSSGGTVNITGNLFYGNTGDTYPVVRNVFATITSGGYNVADVTLGTGSNQSGWTEANTDKTIDAVPISPTTFLLLPASGAANVITTRPIDYPTVDFYGNPINNGAAAGAVQGETSGSGYVIEVSVNNSSRGSVNISPGPNADGLYSGNVTLTAIETAGYIFNRWVINGSNAGSSQTMPIALSANITVQAIFSKIYVVNSADDTTTEGTLRHALTNAQNEDIVSISNTVTTIQLSSRLPTINRNITIEGNGVVLTPNTSWTASSSSQLMYISGSTTEVSISQIHFKDARATSFGGAVENYGILTLESCIFSGNQAGYGGAVENSGTLNITGCTFYENSASSSGGAIYTGSSSTVNLTGNLFYGNTGGTYPVIRNVSATITSGGYNVADVTLGTGSNQSGWVSATGDTTFSSLSIAGVPFNTSTFEPVAGLRSVIPATFAAQMPSTDFNGETRTWPGAPGAVK